MLSFLNRIVIHHGVAKVLCLTCVAALLLVCIVLCVWMASRPRETLRLYLVDGFLTPEECDAIREAALRKGLSRSHVLTSRTPTSTRTSDTVFLSESDDPIATAVFEKVAALTGKPRSSMEDLQVIRYEEGQKYDVHHDPCFKCTKDGGDLLRELTVLMYLNDGFEGGETEFPIDEQSVRPRQGMAAVFQSMIDGRIVQASQHRSVPVTRGTKWAATVWIRP